MRVRNSVRSSEVNFENFAIEAIVDFFANLHVDLTVSIKRNELTIECFWTSTFWSKIRNSCEASRVVTSLIVDFSFALHTDLSAWDRKDELMTNFFACCSRLCLRSSSLNLNVCLQCRHVVDLFADSDSVFNVRSERCEFFSEAIASKIIADSNFDFDVAIEACSSNEASESSKADFFSFSHIELSVLNERRELSIDFFRCCSRLCSRSDFLKLKVSSQCRHVVDFSVDSDLTLNVKDERYERFNRVIVLNVVADSNIEFWDFADEADDSCVIDDFFSISHTKLTALIERWEFLTNFEVSWLWICWYNFLLKLKFYLQSLQIIRTHVISKSDKFSIDSDITSSVFNWRFERLDKARLENVSAKENVFARVLLKRFNEMNSDWILNHSDARSHKHFDNRFSKSTTGKPKVTLQP